MLILILCGKEILRLEFNVNDHWFRVCCADIDSNTIHVGYVMISSRHKAHWISYNACRTHILEYLSNAVENDQMFYFR